MEQIRDDPIVACMERTGYPPWMLFGKSEDIIDVYEYEEDENG